MSAGAPGDDAAGITVSPRAALSARRDAGKTSLVPYLTAGYPDWDRFDRAAAGLAAVGADVFELGVPFSDPLADGPTIQRASQAALEQGVTLEKILNHVGTHRAAWGLPVVLMTYVNPILAYGVDRFCEHAREAQVGGVLISDLPPEETPELWAKLAAHSIETAVLAAPTTRAGRLPVLAAATTGFLYCVSRTGVTGKGKEFASNLGDQIAGLRTHSSLPIVVGFGIRSPEDAVRVKQSWDPDGVVLGARLIEILEAESPDGLLTFLSSVRAALDAAAPRA